MSWAGLVGWERGQISPAIYFDEEVYRREHARVFEGGWVPVGHEDMVRDPGDYVTNYMGEVPVILVRDQAGSVRVFINKCRHRGNQVCLFDRGNVRGLTCSYHGWSVWDRWPADQCSGGAASFTTGRWRRSKWGLEEAAVVNFYGLLFATLNRDAPAFEDWLRPDVRWWLRYFVLAEPIGGLEALPGWHRYESAGELEADRGELHRRQLPLRPHPHLMDTRERTRSGNEGSSRR